MFVVATVCTIGLRNRQFLVIITPCDWSNSFGDLQDVIGWLSRDTLSLVKSPRDDVELFVRLSTKVQVVFGHILQVSHECLL